MSSFKSDWPVYLTSAATVVALLSWLAKWLGVLADGGSTPIEAIAFSLALPAFLRLSYRRLKEHEQI
jgi:hypothetical protein